MRCITDEAGSALLEFSLTLPMVLLLFLGAADFAIVLQQNMVVADSAAAGARYAENAHGTDLANIKATTAQSGAGVPGFSVTASNFCSCSAGGSVVSCASTCGSQAPLQYVTVTTSAPGQLLFTVAGLPSSVPLSASSTMRVPH